MFSLRGYALLEILEGSLCLVEFFGSFVWWIAFSESRASRAARRAARAAGAPLPPKSGWHRAFDVLGLVLLAALVATISIIAWRLYNARA
ncbi:MAG TPA: hypothetical protein VF698_21240 [Thermoanaerobaculia bacterium]